ncbi:MAG: CRTAC1 family protein [Sandaracinaceae bacterium]|nr:CRTAC1 family protein [Sandaracinaceae bacterium]
MKRWISVCALLAVAGCGDPPAMDDAGPPPDDAGPTAMDAGTDAGPPPPMCASTGGGALPSGLETLSYHDGTGGGLLEAQSWAVTSGGTEHRLAEERAYEQSRFQIEQPTRVHGFRVRWAGVDALPPSAELEAGLYPDFGHNGFDMWSTAPYWTGTRCVSELDADGWVTYALDAPVEIHEPGLVYVGHLRDGAGAPGWYFDTSTDTTDGSCDRFADCRMSLNLPDLEPSQYNGLTLPLPYDYLVELLVEPLGDAPEDPHFAPVPDLTVSNRVSFGDFDADGWDDFVTTGPRLYRNAGDGTFVDVTAASGIGALGASGNGVWGDYDNDGCLDLFVFAESMTETDRLLRNGCDGTFSDVTEASGIADPLLGEACGALADVRAPAAAAAWVDLDADGWLDLYVANFICWDSGETYADYVWLNQGDGTFRDRTARDGFSSARLASRGVNPIDYDRDGDMDVLVTRYRLHPNALFENGGDRRFTERGAALGLAGVEIRRAYGHTIGAAWGDLDNDGDFDCVQANLAHPRFFDFSDKTQVLLQDASGIFADNAGDWAAQDLAGANGLRYQETYSLPALADFDSDGDLDLVISAVYDGRPTDLYHGNGDGTFVLHTGHSGITVHNGWAAATSDWDHDGDVDLAMQTFFTNEDTQGHWLSVRVVGNVAANRAAIGATVAVTAGGVTRLRYVEGGTSQGCQDSMYLHYGLADATSVDSIAVTFPGGATVTFTGPFDADQRLWLMEDGTVHPGWAPPAP